MPWQSITEATKDTPYAGSAAQLVAYVESQMAAVQTFLDETPRPDHPYLLPMYTGIKTAHKQAQEALDYIGEQDMETIDAFHTMGAIAQVGTGLRLLGGKSGGVETTPIPSYERAVGTLEENSDDLTEDARKKLNFRKQNLAERVGEYTKEAALIARASVISLEHEKTRLNPDYAPRDTYEAMAQESEEGRRLVGRHMRHGEDRKFDPVDKDAVSTYRALYSLKVTSPETLKALPSERQADIAELNLNTVSRAFAGEYGEQFSLGYTSSSKVHLASGSPAKNDMKFGRALYQYAGGMVNPVDVPYGSHNTDGKLMPNVMLPDHDHYSDFLRSGIPHPRREPEAFQEKMAGLRELALERNGQRIPAADIYNKLELDPNGPDFDLPPAMVMRDIQRKFRRLEDTLATLESVADDPAAQNFQEVLAEKDRSLDGLLMQLKEEVGHNPYHGVKAQLAYSNLYEEANIDARVEALLGVPIDRSHEMTFADSPLLQALSKNFETFHPAKPIVSPDNPEHNPDFESILARGFVPPVPQASDGTTQLGQILAARGGAVVVDCHDRIEPVQFLHDSLSEIAEHAQLIKLENAADWTRQESGAVVLLGQKSMLEKYYESGDPKKLAGMRSGYNTPERDALLRETVIKAYEEHGIKFGFFGGHLEQEIMNNFGLDARLITTNFNWDQQLGKTLASGEGIVIFGGGLHFLDQKSGSMPLDEFLGMPTVSVAEPDARFKGDYDISKQGKEWSVDRAPESEANAGAATNLPKVVANNSVVR